MISQTVSYFRITDKLGEGVYRAEDTRLGRRRLGLRATTSQLVVSLIVTILSVEIVVGQNRSRVESMLQEARPIEAVDTVFTEEMTWMEVRDALRDGKTTVIIATGGVEQNGPYTVTGKHNYVLRATTDAIARKLGNALVAPIVKFVPEGDIDTASGHMRFPGTISVTEETFRALLTDICRSYQQHGFTDIVLIGDSGGNRKGMHAVADLLNAEWSDLPAHVYHVKEYYNEDMWSFDYVKTIGVHQTPDVKSANRSGIHDDYHYEAIIATVDPTLIRTEQRLKAGKYSINGYDMRPPSKTIENGRKLVEYRARITVDALQRSIREVRGALPDPSK